MFLRWAIAVVILTIAESNQHTENWTQQDHVSWTPIYVDTTDRLDLWTKSSTGCECPPGTGHDGGSNDCACCVKPGGCLCSFNSNKCAQCGLEEACQRFCNVSISSRVVASRSGLSWVQIKSPELEGPASCWYRLHNAPGQRIEVQIHRMVSIGRYDNNTLKCSGGFLQFSDGEVYSPSSRTATQICSQNSRYSPPIILFGDQGIATLLIRTDSKTSRSTLLAYVSFSSADDFSVGFQSKGGRLRPHSVCDYIYEDCFDRECVLASPGFPGLFPPHRKCRYYLNANLTTDKIRIHFTVLSLPPKPLCSTHHIAIWKRNLTNLQNFGSPWKTLCQESLEISLEIDGGVGVIEFRSGSTVSPYLYRGFRAVVQFIHTGSLVPPTEPSKIDNNMRHDTLNKHVRRPLITTRKTVLLPILRNYEDEEEDEEEDDEYGENVNEPMGYPRAPYDSSGVHHVSCGQIFEGTVTRGSVFRLLIPKDLVHRHKSFSHHGMSKLPSPSPFTCQLEFRGKPADIVQLAVFNYRIRGSSCSSYIEVHDLIEDEEMTNQTDRILGKLCGPSGNEVKHFTSSHSRMVLVTLSLPFDNVLATEYLDGAFRFHDESIEGTVKPMSSCEVVFYGVTSPPTGTIGGPSDSPLLRFSNFPLVCTYAFIPGPNQTISITLTRGGHDTSSVTLPGSKSYCRSYCGSAGCSCDSKYAALKDIDHLLIVAGSTSISCLCGYFPDALPMTFESQNPLTLVYHSTQGTNDFNYAASFVFRRKIICSNFSIKPPSGSKRWREALGPILSSYITSREFQQYTYFQCVWDVTILPRYNLSLVMSSEENEKDCNTWNLTLWAGNERTAKDDFRNVIGSFCPRNGRQEVRIPENLMEAHIRLSGVSLRPPQFEIRWKYTDVLLPGLAETNLSSGNPSTLLMLNKNYFALNVIISVTSSVLLFIIAS